MLLCNEIHMLMQYYGKEPFYASFSQADTPSLGGGLGWVSVSLNILFSSSHSLPWGGLGWVSGYSGYHYPLLSILIFLAFDLFIAHMLQHLACLFGINGIDFKREHAGWFEVRETVTGNGTIEKKWVVIGHKEGRVRLMCQHMLRHVLAFANADIGRIRHDDVERQCIESHFVRI